jgi:hypothetical protein
MRLDETSMACRGWSQIILTRLWAGKPLDDGAVDVLTRVATNLTDEAADMAAAASRLVDALSTGRLA